MTDYGQFCPVALGAEIFAERWTPLILRELLMGGRRFCDIQRGVPRMSRNLLTQRLHSLRSSGIIEQLPGEGGHGYEYRLTVAGRELSTVIDNLNSSHMSISYAVFCLKKKKQHWDGLRTIG